jgi:pimeloyl-ACP methyl ester carboxylesterase
MPEESKLERYGKLLEIKGEKLCANIEGNGDKVIVILHGAGIASPVLAMKPLAKLLSDEFTVVTLEYFGYGLSDNTKRERTIELITEEIHGALQKLGITKYSIMAHSISGVYGLYFTNKYPKEVEVFIGIDSSVPRQNEFFHTAKINIFAVHLKRLLKYTGMLSLLSKVKPDLLVAKVKGYSRSAEEAVMIRKLSIKNSSNSSILNEQKNLNSNFKKAEKMKFPDDIPVLFFLSTTTIKQLKQWHELHEEIIEGNFKCKIIELEGSHFLYHQFAKEIVDSTKEFIGSLPMDR